MQRRRNADQVARLLPEADRDLGPPGLRHAAPGSASDPESALPPFQSREDRQPVSTYLPKFSACYHSVLSTCKPLKLMPSYRIAGRQPCGLPPRGRSFVDTAAVPKGVAQVEIGSRIIRAIPQ
jgi:hypothetical protein